jgi:glycine/D-amino acid oxidase-like deaminating enzyme
MIDYLIVGQGLAGSVLAYTLCQEGCSVVVVDDNSLPSSSRVAGGLYNPVTGRKLSKTWMADPLFDYLEVFYPTLEQQLNAKFYYPQPIYRPFHSVEEQNTLTAKTSEPELACYLSSEADHDQYSRFLKNDLGGLNTQRGGRLDLPIMLDAFNEYFEQKSMLLKERFDYEQLQLLSASITYKHIEARQLIFCDGVAVSNNPYFRWLPFNPVKGDLFTIDIPATKLSAIVNHGGFVYQRPDGYFTAGSTYIWSPLNWQATELGRIDLSEKLNKLIKAPYTIVEHRAGIRPATQDRRPFIGIHPSHQQVAIFNGLGSKGVSLAPYFAKHFADFLLRDKELLPEVNIKRFFSLYFKQ